MANAPIPTPDQIRKMPVDSVAALSKALRGAGLNVQRNGRRLRITTQDNVLVGAMPPTSCSPQALLNSRAWLARRIAALQPTAAGKQS